jgi:hypothetical protein
MQTTNPSLAHPASPSAKKPTTSDEYSELYQLFESFQPPYREADVRAFSRVYRRIYSSLSREERRRAEWLVDLLIERLEKKELSSLIYGVY